MLRELRNQPALIARHFTHNRSSLHQTAPRSDRSAGAHWCIQHTPPHILPDTEIRLPNRLKAHSRTTRRFPTRPRFPIRPSPTLLTDTVVLVLSFSPMPCGGRPLAATRVGQATMTCSCSPGSGGVGNPQDGISESSNGGRNGGATRAACPIDCSGFHGRGGGRRRIVRGSRFDSGTRGRRK